MTAALRPLLFVLLCALIFPLLRKGGKGYEKGDAWIFPLRPGMRITSFFLLALGFFMAREPLVENMGVPSTILMVSIGATCIFGAIYCLSTSYVVDDHGLSFDRLWRRKQIFWEDLDHYEIAQASSPAPNETYYFRAKDGTTIGVQDVGQDVQGILACIDTHKHLKQKPYKRRHIFGG